MDIKQSSFEEVLKDGRSITYVTVGNSMMPLLSQYKTPVTIIPVKKIKSNSEAFSDASAIDVKKGDILLYRSRSGKYILHRLIKIKDGHLFLRGDNNYRMEEVFPDQVLGVVTHIYRNGKLINVSDNIRYQVYVLLLRVFFPIRRILRLIRMK